MDNRSTLKITEQTNADIKHVNNLFWSAEDCATALKIKGGARSFLQYTACLPSFPKPFELETTRASKRKKLLWNPQDVINWVRK